MKRLLTCFEKFHKKSKFKFYLQHAWGASFIRNSTKQLATLTLYEVTSSGFTVEQFFRVGKLLSVVTLW